MRRRAVLLAVLLALVPIGVRAVKMVTHWNPLCAVIGNDTWNPLYWIWGCDDPPKPPPPTDA